MADMACRAAVTTTDCRRDSDRHGVPPVLRPTWRDVGPREKGHGPAAAVCAKGTRPNNPPRPRRPAARGDETRRSLSITRRVKAGPPALLWLAPATGAAHGLDSDEPLRRAPGRRRGVPAAARRTEASRRRDARQLG